MSESNGSGGEHAQKGPLRRTLDVCVFAPVGLAVTVVEDLPDLVAKGRRRVELELSNARIVGRFVVTQKQRDLSERLDDILHDGGEDVPPVDGDGDRQRCRRHGRTFGGATVSCSGPDAHTRTHARPRRGGHRRRRTGRVRHAQRVAGRAAPREPRARRAARRAALRGVAPQPAHHPQPRQPAPRRGAVPRSHRLIAVELARPAGVEDRTACAHLLALALGAAATMRGGPALVGDATPATLLERWTSPEGAAALFVGEYEGAVVGILGLTEAHTASGPRSLVECCFVEDGARGVGVGAALLEAAVEWSTRRSCAEIDAVALPGDRSTKQRLEAAGFTARLLTLSRRLG